MVKKGKGGKKKKGKKPKAVPVHAFDLDSISLADLKTYITKLEKELALMRKDCAFYSLNKEKIMDFLETMRQVCATQKKTAVVNNSHIDDLTEQLRRYSEMFNERAIISDKENARKKLEKKFNDFIERNTAESQHFDEEFALKKQISDMGKRLDFDRYYYEISVMDTKELLRDAQEELDNKYSKLLESSLKQYVNESLKSRQDFNADKIKMLISIWNIEEQPCEMRESFINEIKDMQSFFYDISSNNNEVIKMLRGKLANLVTEEHKLNFSLQETLRENMELQDVQFPGFYDNNCKQAPIQLTNSNMKSFHIEKKLQKLEFKNEVLKEQMIIAEANLKNLKKQFTSDVRMIYQKADFKAYVLEEIIKMKLKSESAEPENEEPKPILTQTKMKEKADNLEDAVNVFSISVEDSDTLFVPPIYHEFWDPSLRKQFRGNSRI